MKRKIIKYFDMVNNRWHVYFIKHGENVAYIQEFETPIGEKSYTGNKRKVRETYTGIGAFKQIADCIDQPNNTIVTIEFA